MGATLPRLIVVHFNLDQKQLVGSSCSIDTAASLPLDKASREFPLDEIRKAAHWNETDRIVRIIHVPLVLDRLIVTTFNIGQELKVDTTLVRVFPLHIMHGGTSQGYGTDPDAEAKMVSDSGSFKVGDETFQILDFADVSSSSTDSDEDDSTEDQD